MPIGRLVNAWRDTHKVGVGEDGGAGSSNAAKLQGSYHVARQMCLVQ
jgi:hypothetical protein